MASLQEQFAALKAKKANVEKVLAPLRARQSELNGKIAPLNAELVATNREIRQAIADNDLYEIDMALAQLARALGGKSLKASAA